MWSVCRRRQLLMSTIEGEARRERGRLMGLEVDVWPSFIHLSDLLIITVTVSTVSLLMSIGGLRKSMLSRHEFQHARHDDEHSLFHHQETFIGRVQIDVCFTCNFRRILPLCLSERTWPSGVRQPELPVNTLNATCPAGRRWIDIGL